MRIEQVSNAAQVARIAIGADVFDSHHRSTRLRVRLVKYIVQQICKYYRTVALRIEPKHRIGEIPEGTRADHVRDFTVRVACGGDDLNASGISDFDGIDFRVVFRERHSLINNG